MSECKICNFKTNNIKIFENHLKSKKHCEKNKYILRLYYFEDNNYHLIKDVDIKNFFDEIDLICSKDTNKSLIFKIEDINQKSLYIINYNPVLNQFHNNFYFDIIKEYIYKLCSFKNLNYFILLITNNLHNLKDNIQNTNHFNTFMTGSLITGICYLSLVIISSINYTIFLSIFGGFLSLVLKIISKKD